RTWWTPIELSSHVFYLDRAEKRVFEGFRQLGLPLPATLPPIGTLPTFQVNAQAIPVPGSAGKYAIAFETGFLALTSALARITAGVLAGRGGVAVGGQFLDLMFGQVVLGTSAHLHPDTFAVDQGSYELGEVGLRPVFEAFWMAHEYAHVARGHYETIFKDPSVPLPELETEADVLALRVTLRAFDNPVRTLVAIGALLQVLQLFERGYELIGEVVAAPQDGATHPTASDRFQSLLVAAASETTPTRHAEVVHWLGVHADTLRRYWAPLESALPVARDSFPAGWVPRDPREERDALKRWVTLVGKHIT
ncbi:MAG TPA: hypothetical protein VH089_00460, partial [Streptosporangiaceae bacterium]|nr:hypothetical protein [Streptosporangiaceae bacterium]